MLARKDAHDPVVVPFTRDKRRVPLGAFMRESAGAIAPDSTLVEAQYAQLDPMQSHWSESMIQGETYRLSSDPSAQSGIRKQAYREFRLEIRFAQGMKAYMADRFTL